MEIVVLLIPVALGLGGAFAWMFVCAARNGQFEDLDDPASRILQDD